MKKNRKKQVSISYSIIIILLLGVLLLSLMKFINTDDFCFFYYSNGNAYENCMEKYSWECEQVTAKQVDDGQKRYNPDWNDYYSKYYGPNTVISISCSKDKGD